MTTKSAVNGHIETPALYENASAKKLREDAESCLVQYAGPFDNQMIVGAQGIYIYTATGHRILDWTSGQMSCLIGHGHPEIVETIKDHAAGLDHLFSGMLSPPVVLLAQELTKLTPPGLDKAMFLSTGGESNEVAIRLAKYYTGKFEIVGLLESWHGMTGAAQGAQYKAGRTGGGPLMPGNLALPAPNAYRSIFRHEDGSYDWRTELDYSWSVVDRMSCGSLAALIMEPLLSSGGMLTLPPGYLLAMKDHCRRRNMLLIIDEAQTGIGRCGDMFAFEHEGVQPDILTLSKTLGNGLPLSAVITSNEIEQVARDKGFMFYTTHVNDPLPAAVGLKVLQIVQRDNLVASSRQRGERLHAALLKLKDRYGCIGDVRGRGLMAGIEIVADRRTKKSAPDLGARLSQKMIELGLNANLSSMSYFAGVFRIAPPITISDDQLDAGLSIIEEAMKSTEGTQTLY